MNKLQFLFLLLSLSCIIFGTHATSNKHDEDDLINAEHQWLQFSQEFSQSIESLQNMAQQATANHLSSSSSSSALEEDLQAYWSQLQEKLSSSEHQQQLHQQIPQPQRQQKQEQSTVSVIFPQNSQKQQQQKQPLVQLPKLADVLEFMKANNLIGGTPQQQQQIASLDANTLAKLVSASIESASVMPQNVRNVLSPKENQFEESSASETSEESDKIAVWKSSEEYHKCHSASLFHEFDAAVFSLLHPESQNEESESAKRQQGAESAQFLSPDSTASSLNVDFVSPSQAQKQSKCPCQEPTASTQYEGYPVPVKRDDLFEELAKFESNLVIFSTPWDSHFHLDVMPFTVPVVARMLQCEARVLLVNITTSGFTSANGIDIQISPSFVFFRGSNAVDFFDGGHQWEPIVRFVRSHLKPLLYELPAAAAAAADDFTQAFSFSVVAKLRVEPVEEETEHPQQGEEEEEEEEAKDVDLFGLSRSLIIHELQSAAENLRDLVQFGYVLRNDSLTSHSIAKLESLDMFMSYSSNSSAQKRGIYHVSSFDLSSSINSSSSSLESENVVDWIYSHLQQLHVTSFGPSNIRSFVRNNKDLPVVLYMMDRNQTHNSTLHDGVQNFMTSAAQQWHSKGHKQRLSFALLDGEKFVELVQRFGVPRLPFMVLIDMFEETRVGLINDKGLSFSNGVRLLPLAKVETLPTSSQQQESFFRHLEKHFSGERPLPISQRSSPPQFGPRFINPRYQTVSNEQLITFYEFEPRVVGHATATLVLFDSDGCGFCQPVRALFDFLANNYVPNSRIPLQIARYDTLNNAIPLFLDQTIVGYPSVVLFPGHGSKKFMVYDGEWSEASILQFLGNAMKKE